ncbi:hypothetical protein BLNAU_20185 [Blattamonas nauphoetae]|uniref:Uncharacterized protein n=1 Tax=Blattamonas nauphoetae TaxID=2049346 RepID=A0ABQ9WZK0_9EUKA|nr:hypothetical protein BLNAU_20185 [Blattamonas nauphoetae]
MSLTLETYFRDTKTRRFIFRYRQNHEFLISFPTFGCFSLQSKNPTSADGCSLSNVKMGCVSFIKSF